jgi:hypothetical protein
MIFDRTRPANDAEPLAFGCAEHLVLWACRRSADWRQSHDDLAPELLDACGAGAMEIMGALDLFASCLCAARGGFPRPQPCGSLDVSEDELRLLRLFRPVNMEGSTMPSNCCKEWWGLNMAPNFCWQHRPWPKP